MFAGRGNRFRSIGRREVEEDFKSYLMLYDDKDRRLNRSILKDLLWKISVKRPINFPFMDDSL